MRSTSIALLTLAAFACCARDLAAAPGPWRHEGPPPAPVRVEVPTGEGIVLLRTPGPDQVLLRAGAFRMGSDDTREGMQLCQYEERRERCTEDWFAAEQAAHEVYLSAFWIDRTEVTVARYRQCVAAGACTAPPYEEGGERFDRPYYPVVLVSWNDARGFCAWAGGRLPTEAEWERAARGLERKDDTPPRPDDAPGPKGRRFPWGDVYNPFLSNHGAFSFEELDPRDGFLELAPVGSFPDGRTPEGIDDLAGNVQEWVADWFAPEYPAADAVNPKGPDMGERRVVRGGSYMHGPAWLRSAARDKESPGERAPWIGFRCARDSGPGD